MHSGPPPLRILVIDDDDHLPTIFKGISVRQISLSGAYSVESALPFLSENAYDLIVLNIEMFRAFEFLEMVRQRRIPVCLIIDSSPESLAAARFIDYDFIIKPFVAEKVLTQLKRIVADVHTCAAVEK